MSTQLLAVSSFPDYQPSTQVAPPHAPGYFFNRKKRSSSEEPREPPPAEDSALVPVLDAGVVRLVGGPVIKQRHAKKTSERHLRKRSIPALTIRTDKAVDQPVEIPPTPPAKDVIVVERATPPRPLRPLPAIPSTSSYTTRGGMITPVSDTDLASPASAGTPEEPLTLKASVKALNLAVIVSTPPPRTPITPASDTDSQTPYPKSPHPFHRPPVPHTYPRRTSSHHHSEVDAMHTAAPFRPVPQWRVAKSPVSDTAASLRPTLPHHHADTIFSKPSSGARVVRHQQQSRADDAPFVRYSDGVRATKEMDEKKDEERRRTGLYNITVDRAGHGTPYDTNNMMQVIAKLRNL